MCLLVWAYKSAMRSFLFIFIYLNFNVSKAHKHIKKLVSYMFHIQYTPNNLKYLKTFNFDIICLNYFYNFTLKSIYFIHFAIFFFLFLFITAQFIIILYNSKNIF